MAQTRLWHLFLFILVLVGAVLLLSFFFTFATG